MNMAAIFKNGGYECLISQNAPYLKLEDQKMYILSQKDTFYVDLFMKYGKASFFIFHGSHFEYCKKWWKQLLPSKYWNSMVSSSYVPNYMLLSSSENLWPFLTLRALTKRGYWHMVTAKAMGDTCCQVSSSVISTTGWKTLQLQSMGILRQSVWQALYNGCMWSWNRNDDTNNVFETAFENDKYFILIL